MPRTLLEARKLRKSYSVPVLVDFDFELHAGEVHALVGGNGAGKSTFAKIVTGLVKPEAGRMELEGQAYAPRSKREGERSGVVMMMQELALIPTLSVAENIYLGRLPSRGGFVERGRLRSAAAAALARVGLAGVEPETPVESLGIGQQQLVELAKALTLNCRLLILDEPTAALGDPEIELLFRNIRRLREAGAGVIYISHRMNEIRQIADRVTVLRDGQVVATHSAQAVEPADLVREMVGHELRQSRPAAAKGKGVPALTVKRMSVPGRVRNVSLTAHRGEILGLAGLIGAGRTELLRAIFGADPCSDGEVYVGGSEVPARIRRPADAIAAGIGLVPEDRKQQALLLDEPLRVNTTLATICQHTVGGGWLDPRSETATTATNCGRLSVRCASWEQPIWELSGGNQQKVIIARWLARRCGVLLFDEPTRGIDVAAKDTIYGLIRELAGSGAAVVVASSDLPELLSLCDRILVLSAGRLAGEFLPGNWSQEAITQAAFSGHL